MQDDHSTAQIEPAHFNGKVLELFSGIGGMRAGLERIEKTGSIQISEVTAVDINHFANNTYKHNFHNSASGTKGCVVTKLIEQLSPKWLDRVGADIWVNFILTLLSCTFMSRSQL
jgi:site-specific DNA-cytosine methylase